MRYTKHSTENDQDAAERGHTKHNIDNDQGAPERGYTRRAQQQDQDAAESKHLERLPPELRFLIWSAMGEQESFDSLMMTSQSIRNDILHHIPGALLSCECPYSLPCRCGKGFEIDRLVIIVDSRCSERYWLKFHVYRGRTSTPCVWSVADLDAPLAQALRYYRPRKTIVEFRSPNREPARVGAPYMVLRAKLFDVCEVLGWFQQQRERCSEIYFSDPCPPIECAPSQSFWDIRLTLDNISEQEPCPWKWWNEQDHRIWHVDGNLWPYAKRPAVYESLLMPLILNPDWRNSEVTFDQDPRKTTFNYQRRSHKVLVKSESFGYKLLSVTAWAYIDQLITDGPVKLADNDLTPYYEQYDDNVKIWTAEKARRPALQASFQSVLLAMIEYGIVFDLFLELSSSHSMAGHILEPLRSHIRRTRNLSSSNSFSKDRPGAEAIDWLWNLEPIRQAFIFWAQQDGGLKPYDMSAKSRFQEWRKAHTPLWPKSWARNWPPLKRYVNYKWV
ncbi:hypothetical protein GGR51DRAFT_568339 [Nemania sp. FL0031]|nr:hypothetical protein GGR51DRAFT_568339 [Nemania sp. FL0031]